jgi:four helix bundle protein
MSWKEELNKRIMEFIYRVFHLVKSLPENRLGIAITNQIVRSSTSIGANYRAACRAKSRKDFINKLKIVEEETDETLYWLGLVGGSKMIDEDKIMDLKKECSELLAIFVTSLKTAKEKDSISTPNQHS